MRKVILVLAVGAFVGFWACSGAKKQVKKAAALEASGMNEEAANYYWDALYRNPKNLDAQIGLKKTGQIVLDKMIERFRTEALTSDKKAAYYTSAKALRYRADASRYSVVLGIAPEVEAEFVQTKTTYLDQLYQKSKSALDVDDFGTARQTLTELTGIDPAFRDSRTLLVAAVSEPIYRQAKVEMQAGRYRVAYNTLSQITGIQPPYKDSEQLREQSRKLGTTVLGVFPFANASQTRDAELRLYAHCQSELLALKNPFLELVDRENLDLLMQEQKLGVSGIVDDNSAAQTGKLLGLKAVIVGTLLDYSLNLSPLQQTEKRGYEAYWTDKLDTTTKQMTKVRQYKPVKYREFSQRLEIAASFQYKLISTETGRILSTQILTRKASDQIAYATYSGDTKNLFPGNETAVSSDSGSKSSLDALLAARKTMRSALEVGQDVFLEMAKIMSSQVGSAISTD